MDYFLIVLRLIHVVGGIVWVGGALAMSFFVVPSIMATAEAGQKFMGHLMTQTKISLVLTIAGYATVIAGGALYWIDSQGFTSAWQSAGPGIGFGIGGVFGVIGLVAGLMTPKGMASMAKLAAQFKGPPTPEQQSQMAALRKRQRIIAMVNAHSLIIAAVLMAIARYLRF